ncbi:ABC transporter permease [Chryseolinea sp. T2]|uniref:ABC transporter permease n=1 Tax=Chryseolinea sp. T2 TaxID=3129255 RepID=UPI0030776856
MILSYLKVALRNVLKRKAFTLINIFGLAIGVAVCLLIGKYISFETSYDKFHAKGESIYRVIDSFYTGSVKDEYDGYDLGPALAATFPDIEAFTRIHGNGSMVSFTDQGKEFRYREPRMLFVDSAFLKMFSFKIARGDQSSALRGANSIILTESIAAKYFGDNDPIGKIIQLHDGWAPGPYIVMAVIQDPPENTHFIYDFLLPMHTLLQTEFYRGQHERWDNFHTYVQLKDDAAIDKLTASTPRFIQTYRGSDKGIGANTSLQFQPLSYIHYSPDLNKPDTHLATIYLFATIALFVLSIAWINYVNLATARAIERAREVGVKKAIGASRRQLVIQFLVEAGLINFVSVLLAAGIALLLLPVLNSITGRSFQLDLGEPGWLVTLGILFTLGTVVSGVYPAVVLSSFKTTEVIKGKIREESNRWSLRNGMVGFQFACSLLLLVATSVIFRQVNFMKDQDKEFNTKQTIILKGPELGEAKDSRERMSSFRNELLQYPFVNKVATSFSVPGENPSISTGMRKLGAPESDNRVGDLYWIDPNFMDLYGIELLSGESWDPQAKMDPESVIINEEAVNVFQLGDSESALREKLILPFDTARIAGVVKNHHWNSMKKPYTPMIFRCEQISGANVSLQLNGSVHQAIAQIEQKYKADFPDNDFSYYFLDDFYREQYHEEEIFGKLFTVFSILAVVIGCLGLWGLATFATLRRRKEISIRKTLGATAYSIVVLLVRQFLKPLAIAGAAVLPLAWLLGRNWLETFPYRIDLSIDLMILPLGILLLVALITVSYQTLKVAHANPVDSLKGE